MKRISSKRAKALSIPKSVKDKVFERDKHCLWCGSPQGLPEAHFIPRSQGGLGIEENILTLCRVCHENFDHSYHREEMRQYFRVYLMTQYIGWDEDKLKYHK